MNIAVAHHSLNIPGGAERLCLAVIEALRKNDHKVALITVEKTDWTNIQKSFGRVIMPNREYYVTKGRISQNLSIIPVASIYFSVYIMQLLVNRSKRRFDLVINTFGDVVNSIAEITYIHFPLRAALELSQIPAFADKSIWSTVAPLYNTTMLALDKVFPGELLTNSRFMQKIIENVLNRKSQVIYPPVEVESFSSKCFKERKSENMVTIISSYTPKRHLEQVPLIAKHTKTAKFMVIGKADKYSLPSLRKLQTQINTLDLQNRVKLLTNAPIVEILRSLSRAKVYLHVMPYDHFGISVVEAMASGCVPVVHRSGGPWLDILGARQGECGFAYSSVKEAAGFIDRLVSDESLRSEMASRALSRAKEFDKTVFMEEIARVVENVGK